jgi:hypothetical protein
MTVVHPHGTTALAKIARSDWQIADTWTTGGFCTSGLEHVTDRRTASLQPFSPLVFSCPFGPNCKEVRAVNPGRSRGSTGRLMTVRTLGSSYQSLVIYKMICQNVPPGSISISFSLALPTIPYADLRLYEWFRLLDVHEVIIVNIWENKCCGGT